MEGLPALSGNKLNLVILGVLGVVAFLVLRNHKELKKLNKELSYPMPEANQEAGGQEA